MFTITYEDEFHRQWSGDYVYKTLKEAKEHLLSIGFISKVNIYERRNVGWIEYQKAYIEPKRVFNHNEKTIKEIRATINKRVKEGRFYLYPKEELEGIIKTLEES